MVYNKYPYHNFHELNTDWIVKKISNVESAEKSASNSAVEATAAEVKAAESAANAKTEAGNAATSATEAKTTADKLTNTVEELMNDDVTGEINYIEYLATAYATKTSDTPWEIQCMTKVNNNIVMYLSNNASTAEGDGEIVEIAPNATNRIYRRQIVQGVGHGSSCCYANGSIYFPHSYYSGGTLTQDNKLVKVDYAALTVEYITMTITPKRIAYSNEARLMYILTNANEIYSYDLTTTELVKLSEAVTVLPSSYQDMSCNDGRLYIMLANGTVEIINLNGELIGYINVTNLDYYNHLLYYFEGIEIDETTGDIYIGSWNHARLANETNDTDAVIANYVHRANMDGLYNGLQRKLNVYTPASVAVGLKSLEKGFYTGSTDNPIPYIHEFLHLPVISVISPSGSVTQENQGFLKLQGKELRGRAIAITCDSLMVESSALRWRGAITVTNNVNFHDSDISATNFTITTGVSSGTVDIEAIRCNLNFTSVNIASGKTMRLAQSVFTGVMTNGNTITNINSIVSQ